MGVRRGQRYRVGRLSAKPGQDKNVITEFDVNVEPQQSGTQVLAVSGELDAATAPRLRGALDEVIDAGANSILLDLSECSFIDSTGLGVVVGARSRVVEERSGRFELCCAGSQAQRILEITGLDDAFGLHDTRELALQALAA
jgi:anti-sigma B factor antagonist